jgi:mannose-6-phosphate isomerase
VAEPPLFDSSDFTNSSYVKRVDKPWGYELHWVPQTAPYLGKVLHINMGARLSLQLHDQKQESWLLISGEASVIWEDPAGQLITTRLVKGQGYSTSLGQRHRLVGITDCDIVELSTPEKGTTWRLEDDYSRPDETEQQRKIERQ